MSLAAAPGICKNGHRRHDALLPYTADVTSETPSLRLKCLWLLGTKCICHDTLLFTCEWGVADTGPRASASVLVVGSGPPFSDLTPSCQVGPQVTLASRNEVAMFLLIPFRQRVCHTVDFECLLASVCRVHWPWSLPCGEILSRRSVSLVVLGLFRLLFSFCVSFGRFYFPISLPSLTWNLILGSPL